MPTRAHSGARRRSAVRGWRRSQSGVTAIEYALIAALIAVAIIVAVGITGSNLQTLYNHVAQEVTKAIGASLGT